MPPQALSAPTSVQATTGLAGQVTVKWTAVSGADLYQVARSTVAGQRGAIIGSTANAPYNDTAGIPGTVYWYSVQARKAGRGDWGAWSAQVSGSSAVTVAAPPSITNFVASPSTISTIGTTVTLSATVVNATSLTLDGSPVTLPAIVTPSATHTYTLAASSAGGTVTSTVTVTVTAATSPVLTISSPTTIDVYPVASPYGAGQRVWVTAPLRASNGDHFARWLLNGTVYDVASTTTVVMSAACSLTAVYEPAPTSGIVVTPGIDSLANALAMNTASGLTFLLKAGVHRFTRAVSPLTGTTIQGENGAILNGSKVLTNFTAFSGHWIATGQTQNEQNGFSLSVCVAGNTTCIHPEKVFRDNRPLTPVASLAQLVSGTFFFDYANTTIHVYDDPTGHLMEATVGCGGIVGYSGANDNVTIRNLIFEKFGGSYVAGEGDSCLKAVPGWLVDNCEVRYASAVGVIAYSGTVRNSYIHHCGQYGVTGSGRFEGCVIQFNNLDGFDPNNNAGGSKFLHSTGQVVRGNYVSDNVGSGLWWDYDNSGSVCENNRCYHNDESGIKHEANCGITIRYNHVVDNNRTFVNASPYDASIILRMCLNAEIYGNDISAVTNHEHAISISEDASVSYTPAQCGTISYSSNISVHDNVIRLAPGNAIGVIGASAGTATPHGVSFKNNTYHLSDLSAGYFWWDNFYGPQTVAQWQAQGQDATGTFAN